MNDDENINRSPYVNTEGQLELHESIVAFVDILGFKSLVKNAKNEEKSKDLFKDFYRVLSTWFNRIEDMNKMATGFPLSHKKDSYKIRIFTDCILIGCPIRQNANKSNFIKGANEFYEILSLLYLFQLEMVNQGYFIRGAISVDELYMDDLIIYGTGVIDAYEAESKQAKFPRIILTKSAETMFVEMDKGFINQKTDNYINRYLNRDSDGYLFLNYLESIKIGDNNYQFVDDLEKHQNTIEESLGKHKNDPHLLEKYIWVANYHNFFCSLPPLYAEYIIDLTEYQMNSVK